MMRSAWIGAALFLFTATSGHGQSVVGRVVDRGTMRPVPAAAVTLLSATGRTLGRTSSDSVGVFTFQVSGRGGYRLQAQRIGYRPVTSPDFDLGAREILKVDLHLSVHEIDLEPLVVRSRAEPPHLVALERAGYYERERTSPGLFMRREDIARTRGSRLSDVLGRIPGARAANIRGRAGVALGRSRGTARACTPAVFLDGLQVLRPESIDDIVHLGAVEAMEVYRGPSHTPAQFGGGENGCGVVVIWTRRQT